MQGNIDVVSVGALWIAEFKNYNDDLMLEAMQLVLKSNNYWPTVADISSAIKELQREARLEPRLQYLNPRSKWTSPIAAKAIAMVKADKTKAYLKQINIKPIINFARKKFPGISVQSMESNYNELHTCMKSQERCQGCMWEYGYCDTNGFYYEPYMRPDGQVTYSAVMCKKHPSLGLDLRKSKRGK